MKQNEIFWQEISSDIKKELQNINKLQKELDNAVNNQKIPGIRRMEGSILHDFYNCCERVFRRISVEINGSFTQTEAWHKDLLYRMTIPVQTVRPEVISEELAAELDDYLSFRHVFRNIYGFELKGERLERLVAKFNKVSQEFINQINKFLSQID